MHGHHRGAQELQELVVGYRQRQMLTMASVFQCRRAAGLASRGWGLSKLLRHRNGWDSREVERLSYLQKKEDQSKMAPYYLHSS